MSDCFSHYIYTDLYYWFCLKHVFFIQERPGWIFKGLIRDYITSGRIIIIISLIKKKPPLLLVVRDGQKWLGGHLSLITLLTTKSMRKLGRVLSAYNFYLTQSKETKIEKIYVRFSNFVDNLVYNNKCLYNGCILLLKCFPISFSIKTGCCNYK